MQIKSVDNLLQAITEKLYITKTNKYKNALPELEETYNTIIIMLIENLDYQEVDEKNLFSNLKKIKITSTNQNIEEYQKKIIHKLNKEEEIKAYSFLPTGLGHYENIDELMNQLIRQSTLEEKKYIYVNINIDDKSTLENPLKNLIKELKNTLLIIVGNKENTDVPLIVWSEKEKKKSWIIRHPNEKEYSPFIHMSRELEKLYTRKRHDIFNSKIPYGKVEFNALCNPHQLRTLLIYEEDGNILGYIEGQVVTTERTAALTDSRIMRINKLFVKEENRRQKIGTRLYQAILEKAKEEKCDRIEVQVYNFTPEAQSFMSALGLDILSYQYEFRVPKK